MNPHQRLHWTLVSSLVLWAPVVYRVFNNNLDWPIAALYYVAGLMLSWIATGIVSSIATGYRGTTDRVALTKQKIELIERRAKAAEEHQRRRKADSEEDDDDE